MENAIRPVSATAEPINVIGDAAGCSTAWQVDAELTSSPAVHVHLGPVNGVIELATIALQGMADVDR